RIDVLEGVADDIAIPRSAGDAEHPAVSIVHVLEDAAGDIDVVAPDVSRLLEPDAGAFEGEPLDQNVVSIRTDAVEDRRVALEERSRAERAAKGRARGACVSAEVVRVDPG